MLLLPAHFYTSCAVSGAIATAGCILSAITAIFALLDRRAKKMTLVLLAFIGLTLHGMLAH